MQGKAVNDGKGEEMKDNGRWEERGKRCNIIKKKERKKIMQREGEDTQGRGKGDKRRCKIMGDGKRGERDATE